MQGGVISQKNGRLSGRGGSEWLPAPLVAGRSLLGVATLATLTKGLQEDHGPADVAQYF